MRNDMKSNDSGTIDPGLRKAAILVRALDEPLAESLLDGLGPYTARMVYRVLEQLEPVDAEEEESILVDFYRLQRVDFSSEHCEDDLDTVCLKSLNETASRPFDFLGEAENDELVQLLSVERPQTIALILSHFETERASAVLTRFSGRRQAEVVRRLVELEEADPEVIREVEAGLKDRLDELVPARRKTVAGLSTLSGILSASDGEAGKAILDNLARYDKSLAGRLVPRSEPVRVGPLSFDEVIRMPSEAMRTLIHATDPKLWELALIGSPLELVLRLLSHFPSIVADTIYSRLERPGPIRLSDVELAREKLVESTRLMVEAGQLDLPAAMRHPSLHMIA
jgi:flagellar motor switch protein FliG